MIQGINNHYNLIGKKYKNLLNEKGSDLITAFLVCILN